MNMRAIFLAGLCLLLWAGWCFPQAKKKAQKFSEMKVSLIKPTTGVVPPQDSSVLVVKFGIPNLEVTSTLGESSVRRARVGVFYIVLAPEEPQTLYFNATGYKQVERPNIKFEKNRSYEVEVNKKGGSKLWWIIGGAATAGGAFVALTGGGGTTPPPPVEKLPDPPGGPTGN